MIVYPEGTPRCPQCGAPWQWPSRDGDHAVWTCAKGHVARQYHGPRVIVQDGGCLRCGGEVEDEGLCRRCWDAGVSVARAERDAAIRLKRAQGVGIGELRKQYGLCRRSIYRICAL